MRSRECNLDYITGLVPLLGNTQTWKLLASLFLTFSLLAVVNITLLFLSIDPHPLSMNPGSLNIQEILKSS